MSPDLNIHELLGRQYRAALEMLGQAIEECPESLWLAPEYPNKYWHIAFHVLFYTHLYLQTSEAEFTPWAKHRPEYQFLGPMPWPPHDPPRIGEPYSKEDVLEYHAFCLDEIGRKLPLVDLGRSVGV